MAGDWIPMRVDLADDPAVIALAGALGTDDFAVVGRLHKLWAWANRHLAEGVAKLSPGWVDRYVSQPGFARELVAVGWLTEGSDGSVSFPKFDRWNSQGAKRRLSKTQAKRGERSVANVSPIRRQNVAKMSPSKGDKTATREEKRRDIEEANASSCPEPAEPASGPAANPPPESALAVPDPEPIPDPVLAHFPASGPGAGKGWPLRQSKLDEWQAAYPGLDCRAELRKAKQWLADNPGRRKTLAGMPRFLGAWLARAQDQPRPTARGPTGFMDRGAAQEARMMGQIFEALPEYPT